ncbi:class V aminotransferase (macronuclear) [Tetrahymena thermophila SB210]|uniref:Class V aminotransferase n=1 Tax=Tetrahymena thermophila (strain SB210) TaxID=312017 RepID=Q22AR7_TETTS|nr:class V aminotransferase [Tetrahymena thermophila SB210]EAR82368.1 class V aminotransferase [Tetrahymena thermophila SB210]|eukprot:XP_001030031.1 class V aminotransferase [Tetrahymena thermophila SB210]
MEFGKQLLALFPYDETYINLNHASVGMEPIHIGQKRIHYLNEINKNPEKWYRFHLFDEMKRNRQLVADFVGSKINEITFVMNATQAFQDVLAAIQWKEGDTIVYTNIAYPAMKNQIKHLAKLQKLNAVEVVLTKEIVNDNAKILKAFEDVMIANKDKNLKAVAFDHISSVPSMIFPIEDIVALCKKYNCLSICDGAQTPGHININLHKYDVDYYISNMHKWSFTARPFAFIFIKESLQHEDIHPSIIGNYYGKGYVDEFNGKGTNDPSPFFTVQEALDFRKMLGEERIQSYSRNMAYRAGQIFAETWGTQVLHSNKDMYVNLVNIEVPFITTMADMSEIAKDLLFKENFWLTHFLFDGKIYVRISGYIFNEESDYIHCSAVALKYIKNYVEKHSS